LASSGSPIRFGAIEDERVKTTNLQVGNQRLTLPARGFSQGSLEALSASQDEPSWLLQKRTKAWHDYGQLPAPSWRRTDISKLRWEELIPFAPPQAPVTDLAVLPPKLHEAVSVYGQRAGLLLQRDSARVYLELDERFAAQGVLWTDLQTAVREYPELIQRHFRQKAVPVSSDKYTALHAAFWSGGTLLYVPKNAEISLPFVSVLWQEMPQLAIMAPTLLIAEAGSQVTLVSELLSMGCEACPDSYHGGVTEMYIGPGARVRYINTQDLGRQVYDLRTQTAMMDRGSYLEWLTVNLGGRLSRSSQHSILHGPGAEAVVTGLYLPDGKQHVAFHTLQDHLGQNCKSDLLYQGALLGRSRSVYEGTIRARPGAQKTDAYQSNRNLLISPQARADSLPQLEIEANDLRCTHGATVSQVDDEQIFYLMSRGLPRPDAVRLIVEGFFQPTLDRLPESLEGLRDRLREAIAAKLAA
jgi:Fe-S cluster assembly protein SufD